MISHSTAYGWDRDQLDGILQDVSRTNQRESVKILDRGEEEAIPDVFSSGYREGKKCLN